MTHAHIEKWDKGRFWFRELFHVEWSILSRNIGMDVRLFDGDSDRDITLFFGCRLFAVWLVLESILPKAWIPKVDYKTSYGCSREFGFSYHSNALWLHLWHDDGGSGRETPWYMRQLVLDMPWRREWVRTSTLLNDQTWDHETPQSRRERKVLKALPQKEGQKVAHDAWRDRHEFLKENRWKEEHAYQYTLRGGEVQNVTATISVEEREWRPKWFKWTSLFANTSRSLKIDFSDEVGEGTGSWKGGTVGCGYDLRPDETPLECLRRMERERVFR